MQDIRLITFDLDDTLWPIAPVIANAEQALHDWFAEHCPAVARRHSVHSLRQLRFEVQNRHPELAGDITALRKASIRLALATCRADESLTEPAFETFWDARNRIEFFPDVMPALQRLKRHYRLAAVTNGNADIHRIGLGDIFDFSLTAREAGCEKPACEIFLRACETAGVDAGATLHVGDDIRCDIEGALGAGLHAAWIDRSGIAHYGAHAGRRHEHLAALADHLESLLAA